MTTSIKQKIQDTVAQIVGKSSIFRPYRKAIGGFVAAGGLDLWNLHDGGVTGSEWRHILIAALAGAGIVFITPKNKPKGV